MIGPVIGARKVRWLFSVAMMGDENSIFIVERRGGTAVVTLNRPHAMNALSRALRRQLASAINTLDQDDDVRVIVLTGAGDRAFSAGLDLKELGDDPAALSASEMKDTSNDPVMAIEACRCPVIAAVNGVAVTGGFELALACDIVLASSNARFADTHARVGVLPGWGLSQKLPRIIGPSRAKELSFSGRFIDADTAADWGLVNRTVPPQQLLDEALALADEIALGDATYIRALKSMIDDGVATTLAEGRQLERERSGRWNADQSPDVLEARREAVMSRGRAQASTT